MMSTRSISVRLLSLTAALLVTLPVLAQRTPLLVVRNNHDLPYRGPVEFRTDLPDGTYRSSSGLAVVSQGVGRAEVNLAAQGSTSLERKSKPDAGAFDRGKYAVRTRGTAVLLGRAATMDIGLVVLPGTDRTVEDVAGAFTPLPAEWVKGADGRLHATTTSGAYRVALTATPYAGGVLDVAATLTRSSDAKDRAYVALVRRVEAPGTDQLHIRFNGRVADSTASPTIWNRDFWYTRGVDWTRWQSGTHAFVATSAYTPSFSVETEPDTWISQGSHFYVWERSRLAGGYVYLISEIAGPNPDQEKSRYMPVIPYAQPVSGDTLRFGWRLAVDVDPAATWEESQYRVYAGYRSVTRDAASETVDLGVAATEFGTSYFPYSTLPENFDYYRTPGLDKETWWAFSPDLWKNWRAFIPRMQTDLHIIKAMGFGWVRLHHLELLNQMDRQETIAYLDWFIDQARKLDLKVLIDSEGPAEWIALVAGRYRDVVRRIEVENEIIIGGIKPGDPERWTALYHAAKQVAPESDVFMTGAGNQGNFERMKDLGIPFDRVGLHAYKHGPGWEEAFSSHVLGAANHATQFGLPMTLGEFNWKNLTEWSPEDRAARFEEIYDQVLHPRAVPELFQFHFQETLSVNPSISRSGIRHYETISLDRRPKLEALALMRLIRKYGPKTSPVNVLGIHIGEVQLKGGKAAVQYSLINRTSGPLSVTLDAVSFDGLLVSGIADAPTVIKAGATLEGTAVVSLPPTAPKGTFHYFLRVNYGTGTAFGWGIAANPGAPVFKPDSVLPDLVGYTPGTEKEIDFTRPLAVTFGKEAPTLEMEMAYILANTLQSATGKPVYLSSWEDLSASHSEGTVFLVGTAKGHPGIGAFSLPATEKGTVQVLNGGRRVLLTGRDRKAVQAVTTDFVLRYWLNAKDATIRVSGMEPGAARGKRAGVTVVDPP